jgi:predicted dehydrogenase
MIQEGKIGKLRHIRIVWAFPQKDDSRWVAKDELARWWSLAAVGSHCIDLARWFASDMHDWKQFKSVINNNKWNGPHDETAVIAGQFSSGPTIEIASSVQFGPYKRVELFGDKGMAICEDTLGRLGSGDVFVNGNQLKFNPISPFIGQLTDFTSSMASNKRPRAGGLVGLRNLEDLFLVSEM